MDAESACSLRRASRLLPAKTGRSKPAPEALVRPVVVSTEARLGERRRINAQGRSRVIPRRHFVLAIGLTALGTPRTYVLSSSVRFPESICSSRSPKPVSKLGSNRPRIRTGAPRDGDPLRTRTFRRVFGYGAAADRGDSGVNGNGHAVRMRPAGAFAGRATPPRALVPARTARTAHFAAAAETWCRARHAGRRRPGRRSCATRYAGRRRLAVPGRHCAAC